MENTIIILRQRYVSKIHELSPHSWQCGACSRPPRHTHTHNRDASVEHPFIVLATTSSSHCHCFVNYPTVSKSMQRSPHHTPTVGGIPNQHYPRSSPQVQQAFVLLLSFQKQAPQARGSAQKTPRIWPSTRPLFPIMAWGATSNWESGSRKAGQD